MIDLEKRLKEIEDRILRLTMDNISSVTIEDRTHGTANTQKLIPHSLGSEPQGYVVVTGDVYIKDMDEKQIDIRSTQASMDFKIKLLR